MNGRQCGASPVRGPAGECDFNKLLRACWPVVAGRWVYLHFPRSGCERAPIKRYQDQQAVAELPCFERKQVTQAGIAGRWVEIAGISRVKSGNRRVGGSRAFID